MVDIIAKPLLYLLSFSPVHGNYGLAIFLTILIKSVLP